MTRAAIRPFARTALNRCALALALALAACGNVPMPGGMGLLGGGTNRAAPQFTRGGLDRLWAAAPGALVMVQRGGAGEGEQIVGLDNATALRGDNFMWLRAHAGRADARFDLDDLVRRVGGVPAPFRRLDNSNLRSATDSLGTYFWQDYRDGVQTSCVIAFRRLSSGARALPRGTGALDVFLRNCVHGSVEEALTPIRDERIGRAALAGSTAPDGGNRALSPLAAPRL